MYLALWDVPNRTYVKVIDEDAGDIKDEVFFFDHPDGVYSFCLDKDGQVVHLPIGIEVLPVKGFE